MASPMILANEVLETNRALRAWVMAIAEHTQPSFLHWCDGRDGDLAALEREMVAAGSLIDLDQHRSLVKRLQDSLH